LVTSLLAYAIFREPLTARKLGGVLLGFAGVTLVVFGDSWEQTAGLHFGVGECLVVLAMLGYVVSGLFIKKATQSVNVIVVTGYSHIFATILLAITGVGQVLVTGNAPQLPTNWFVWAVLLFSGWVATGLCTVWWNSGIRVIGAGRTAMFLNGMPIMSLVFSMLLLGEHITWVHIVGFLAVFVAIYLGTTQKKALVERAA
ncbi:MAG: DMT family transporter, partial [Tumebacillaceae bacterium]